MARWLWSARTRQSDTQEFIHRRRYRIRGEKGTTSRVAPFNLTAEYLILSVPWRIIRGEAENWGSRTEVGKIFI